MDLYKVQFQKQVKLLLLTSVVLFWFDSRSEFCTNTRHTSHQGSTVMSTLMWDGCGKANCGVSLPSVKSVQGVYKAIRKGHTMPSLEVDYLAAESYCCYTYELGVCSQMCRLFSKLSQSGEMTFSLGISPIVQIYPPVALASYPLVAVEFLRRTLLRNRLQRRMQFMFDSWLYLVSYSSWLRGQFAKLLGLRLWTQGFEPLTYRYN